MNIVELGEFKDALCASWINSDGRAPLMTSLSDVAWKPQAGDILLVEAFLEFADLPEASWQKDPHTCSGNGPCANLTSHKVERNFSFVAVVPESAPPRHGRRVDQGRGWLALLLLAFVIVCSLLLLADVQLQRIFWLGFLVLCLRRNQKEIRSRSQQQQKLRWCLL